MDLGTGSLFDLPAPMRVEADEPVAMSPSEALLAGIRDNRRVLTDAQLTEVTRIAEWALLHVVDHETAASTLTEQGLNTGLPVAGPGAPLISDFAVMELSAVLGRTKDSGRNYVGQVVELARRLPRTWARVQAGQVPVWKGLRIADSTRLLPAEAAGAVDRRLAPFAHGASWAQIDRLVQEALIRFDPAAAEERRQAAAEARHVDLGLDQVDATGIAHGTTALDLPDALDLEAAIARRARLRGQLGDEDSLHARRAKALGELARHDLTLDLEVTDPATGEVTRTVPARKVELMLHLSEDALVARCGNTRTPITGEQVREWLDIPDTRVTVRPVVDLAGHQPVDSYEIPDRLRWQVTSRDHHCVFPHCTRPAESCDLDHVIAHREGGATCPCNLVPKCRGHHRYKTSGRVSYRVLHPGTYHWTTPTGTWLVDPTGTYLLSADPPEE